MLKVLFAMLLVFPQLSWGKSLASFEKRFEFIKEDGKVVEIRDKSLTVKFSIRPYLEFIKNALREEQRLMQNKGDYTYLIENLFADESQQLTGDKNHPTGTKFVLNSMLALKEIDFDKVFSDPKFNEVINKFEKKLTTEMSLGGFNVLARLDNAKFFYKKNVTYQIVKWALDFAKKRLSTIPLLNTASYVLVQVEQLIRERRTFHQNMLLYYFENFPESELGLEKEEVDLAVSSIYESRISWMAFWESNFAVANWDRYGMDKFYTQVRSANSVWRANRSIFSSTFKKINFAFKETEFKEELVIVNLFDQESLFQKRPAIAHFIDKPNFIKRKRMVLQLAQLGVSYLPLPSFIKSFAERYFKSFYEQHKLTEGSLYGYFEANELEQGMENIRNQYLNPFDPLKL